MSTPHVTVYATDWCPFCRALLAGLDHTDVAYTLVDVDADSNAAEWVKSVNNGNRIVPTVKYSDGSHDTNPPAEAVVQKVAQL